MKRTIIIFSLVLSGFAFSQKSADNPFVYEETSQVDDAAAKAPGTPADPVPVDGYIPFLLVAGAAIAGYYTRKKAVSVN